MQQASSVLQIKVEGPRCLIPIGGDPEGHLPTIDHVSQHKNQGMKEGGAHYHQWGLMVKPL